MPPRRGHFTHGGCFPGIERPKVIALTHYAGNAGTGPGNHLGRGDSSRSESQWQRHPGYPGHVPGVKDGGHVTGVIGILGIVREDDVDDGHSKTMRAENAR